MAVIGIYDLDFMTYQHVIPNLECAKLYTYYHNMHEIAVLAPRLEPQKYTKFFIRKEYNDGIYPQQLFLPNCEYGGRAFNPDKYSPLEPVIEKTIPNMHLYDKYADRFCSVKSDKILIKRILNCAHIRLSTDEATPKPLSNLERIMQSGRYTGIIFHDYDLAKVKNAYDIIDELSRERHFVTKQGINPYPIGNKFPIQVKNSDELQKWLKIKTTPNLFFLQYNGLMNDETVVMLCEENKRMARQMYYNISYGCSSENEFINDRLPKIFKQVLFLRTQHIKILLEYDEELIVTPELKKLIELMNCWLSFTWQENFIPNTQTLYDFVRHDSKYHYQSWAFLSVTVTTEEARASFRYIYERNYELFKLFYEWDAVKLKGGQFDYGWE